MSEGDSHESDILFCPFCGDVDALEVQHLEGAILYPAYRVACDNCGAAFAIRSDIDEWNTRALPAVQPDARVKEYEEAYQYALHLAEALRKNYPPNHDFRFLGDLVGLLTQIDNMVAGLSQSAVQSFDCECGQVGPCNSQFCTPRAALKGETP